MYPIQVISDYIINACKVEGNNSLNVLKHQKLLYYVQAWHLAFFGNDKLAFDEDFAAWVHGPVNRTIYISYKNSHSIFSELNISDIQDIESLKSIDPKMVNHINSVLEVYASLSGSELEELSHRELPWLEAREGYGQYQRCVVDISRETMGNYYRKRLE